MKRTMVFPLALLLCLVMACSLTNVSTGGSTPVGNTNNPGAKATPPSKPVGIQTGLASLNAYSLTFEINSSGPTQAEYSNSHTEITKSTDQDATSTHYTITELTADESEPTTTDSYSYTIGDAQCSGSDADGWEYTTLTPQQSEMQNLIGEMIDATPLIDTPTFVGSENMNGIMTNHFTFQVSGLGVQSGAEVVANQGDYWLAQDGQYIVKYTLVIETLDTTTQSTMHMEVLIDLTNINQPVNIAFPSGCVPK